MEKNQRIAIVPGSFDPITRGHIDIAERASKDYDKIYLSVMINADKKYMFTLAERKAIAEAACRHIENLEVISSEGYLWKLAKELGAVAIVKGVRNEADREYELKMAEYNASHYPDAKTVLLDARDELDGISSTEVRAILQNGGEGIDRYISSEAKQEIFRILAYK